MSEEMRRARNFSEFDKNLLIEVASSYTHIIENKRTDGPTIRLKNETWDTIQKQYNINCQTGSRSAKQLHELYDNLKRKAKKILHTDKANLCKVSGGGTLVLVHQKSVGLEEKIINNILKPHFQAVPNDNEYSYDSSTSYFAEDEMIEETEAAHIERKVSPTFETDTLELFSPPCKRKKLLEDPEVELNTASSTKENDTTNIDVLTKRIVERKNFKDQLSNDLKKRKEEILDIEKTIKEKELFSRNIDMEIKKTQLQIVQAELENKNECGKIDLQIKKIELEIKTVDLEIKKKMLSNV